MMEIQRRITQPYFNLARHQYAPLIHKLAFRIGISQENIDELKTQGVKELLKCMICYNKSGSFMTFLNICEIKKKGPNVYRLCL